MFWIWQLNIQNSNEVLPTLVIHLVDILCFRWGSVTVSQALLNELLPGPVTVVFERTLSLNPGLNPGTTLVGIRVPNHGFVRDLSRVCGEPLALTSANPSAAGSTLTVQVSVIVLLGSHH